MVIVAHPDDADFGPAATAASWIDAGSTGWLVCRTSGDAGSEDPAPNPLDLAALREVEQARATTAKAQKVLDDLQKEFEASGAPAEWNKTE